MSEKPGIEEEFRAGSLKKGAEDKDAGDGIGGDNIKAVQPAGKCERADGDISRRKDAAEEMCPVKGGKNIKGPKSIEVRKKSGEDISCNITDGGPLKIGSSTHSDNNSGGAAAVSCGKTYGGERGADAENIAENTAEVKDNDAGPKNYDTKAGLHDGSENGAKRTPQKMPLNKRLLNGRFLSCLVIFVLLPAALVFYCINYEERRFWLLSLFVILCTIAAFFFVFEKKRLDARTLVIIAVMCAACVVGRLIFFFLPQFKPVAALVIIFAVSFGPQCGFIVGSLSMFVSNFFHGQGAHTPWQMIAMGLLGFLAGLIFKNGAKHTLSVVIYGGLATFFIYGALVDISTILAVGDSVVTLQSVITTYIFAIPANLTHAASSVIFLAVGFRPIYKILHRVKIKFGILETT